MNRSVAEHQQAVALLLRGSSGYDGGTDAAERLPLAAARSRVLAADVAAPVSLPPFDNSQMDGYAVHSADLAAAPADHTEAGRLRLKVGAPIPAGTAPPALEPGTAAPIMTGAMIPAGAGAVVPIELADPPRFLRPDGRPAADPVTVGLPGGTESGSFIRRRGSDIAAGGLALAAGTLLGPAQLGLLAACGIPTVPVRPRFTVLLLSTGDEVTSPGEPLGPGRIYDANSTLLEAALHEAGAAVIRHQVVGDDPVRLREALAGLSGTGAHLILTSGGISKGAYEVVKQALDGSGVTFTSVALQPGGPQALGTVGGLPFLGFPGNPVSALVSFEMFLRPALTALTGAPSPRVELEARLAAAADSPETKHQVRRGRYADGVVELIGGPGSHLVHALAESNALVHLPEGTGRAAAGERVRIWLIDAVQAPNPQTPNL